MGESNVVVRYADIIVDRATQHAWVLRSNLESLNMRSASACAAAASRPSFAIDEWHKAGKAGVGWLIIKHRAAWETVTEPCPCPEAPVSAEGLARGPVIAVDPVEE